MSSTTYRISKPCRAITCCYSKRCPFISDVYCYACSHNVLSIWLFAVNSAFVRYNSTTLNDALVLRSRRIPPPRLVLTATCLFLFLLHIAHCRIYTPPPPRLTWDIGVLLCVGRKVRHLPSFVNPIAICLYILPILQGRGDTCRYVAARSVGLAWRHWL